MKFRFAKGGQPQPGSKPRACLPMKLFPTALVGSYPQPDWLIDRQMLSKRMPPRIRADELWRVPPVWPQHAITNGTPAGRLGHCPARREILNHMFVRL